jgi:hypothetical protein
MDLSLVLDAEHVDSRIHVYWLMTLHFAETIRSFGTIPFSQLREREQGQEVGNMKWHERVGGEWGAELWEGN